MIVDTSLLWRKALGLAPRWVRYSLVSSAIAGECLEVANKIVFGSMKTSIFFLKDVTPINLEPYEWPFVGILLVMPVVFLFHTLSRLIFGPSQFEKAEEYIAVMKMAVASAGYTPVQAKVFWGTALGKLAKEFSVDASPPDPKNLIMEGRDMAAPS